MGKLAKSLKNSIWYASKILKGTRYAEQNWKVRGTPWGEGVIASEHNSLELLQMKKNYSGCMCTFANQIKTIK